MLTIIPSSLHNVERARFLSTLKGGASSRISVNRRVWAVPPGVAPEVDRLMIVDVDDDLGHECRSRVFGTDRVEAVSGFHLPAPHRISRALNLRCSAPGVTSSPPRNVLVTALL